jgi:drug/metabolite transporter (DMT)-like permease
MLFLTLSAACSVLLGFIFKLFPRFGIDGFQAIVFNYATCFACGWLHLGHFPIEKSHFDTAWMPYALTLGFIFVSGFNLAALTVRHFGVTIGQIMQKMSILMTAPFAIWAYGEPSGAAKITGIALALASIVLVNWPKRNLEKASEGADRDAQMPRLSGLLWIPLATWALSGLLEVLLVVVNNGKLADTSDPTFIIAVFGTAGFIGLCLAVVGWATGKLRFAWKNVLAGLILGVPNYGSLLFILLALETGLGGSFVFPVTNVGIIVLTTFGAVALFGERLSRINWAGIATAVLAIWLISK